MASDIPHPGVFVHNFLQVIDIILLIGQNKNTLKGYGLLHPILRHISGSNFGLYF
jgi:hypothetical protein